MNSKRPGYDNDFDSLERIEEVNKREEVENRSGNTPPKLDMNFTEISADKLRRGGQGYPIQRGRTHLRCSRRGPLFASCVFAQAAYGSIHVAYLLVYLLSLLASSVSFMACNAATFFRSEDGAELSFLSNFARVGSLESCMRRPSNCRGWRGNL